jgi:glycerol-3-phosphate dehydrogenase (NAD(P)+)
MNKDVADYKLGVVGAGSWGTALANLLATKGYGVDHWVFEKDICAQMATELENRPFLPGVRLSANLHPSNDLERVVADKDLVLLVVPSHVMRPVTARMAELVGARTLVVCASKGIENDTLLTMSGVLGETLPRLPREHYAVLSGPSFAREVAQEAPTAVTVASASAGTAETVQQIFATPAFRVYAHDDVIGVELGGSVKNVIAIAAGVIDGLGMGLNTRAALITRGLTEMRRLGLRMGANPRTFPGLAGMGDLVLTCTGDLSRNHTIGKQIGKGKRLKDLLAEMQMVAEGVKTAKSVHALSRKLEVEMPISQAIYQVLYEDLPAREAAYQLMTRDLKPELDET